MSDDELAVGMVVRHCRLGRVVVVDLWVSPTSKLRWWMVAETGRESRKLPKVDAARASELSRIEERS